MATDVLQQTPTVEIEPEPQLTREEQIALKNRRAGVFIFQASWILAFMCLIWIHSQIRGNFATWPPPGVAALDRVLPTVATAALILSAFTARRGLRAVVKNAAEQFYQNWQITVGLGIFFLVIMAVQWVNAGSETQYNTIYRVMVGYHAVHALVCGYLLVRAQRAARTGGISPLRYWSVEAAANLWYFVVVAWVLFYLTLYIF